MAKFFGVVLTITRTLIVASALAMAAALPIWSSTALAQKDIRTSSEGDDTFVKRTYDDKTGKLLEVVKDTETRDPNDRTKILKKVTTKKYDQGKRPHYETTVDEQEIVLDGRKRLVRKQTKTSTTYKKTKQRDLVSEIKEVKELVALDANGVPIYTGTRVTTRGKGFTPEKNEVWDVRTRKWVSVRPGLKQLLEAQKQQLLEAQRQKNLNRPEITKEDIKKNKDKRKELNKERKLALRENPNSKAGEERIVEADEGGMLTGKALKPSDFEGCGASFLKFDVAENFGWVSTSCPRLTGGRIATKADYLTYCNSFDRNRIHCGPPGPGTEKRIEKSGIQGMPFSAFCLGLHLNILASKGDVFNSKVKAGKLVPVFKYDNGSRKLECYFVSFAQSKALRDQYKNIDNNPGGKPPVAVSLAEPSASMSLTDPGTGVTTTIVTNPDGTRTITRTGRNGKVISRVTAGKSPSSMSSPDPGTGVTTTIVTNPDGTRTITRTGRNGKVISRVTAGKSPAFMSSTDRKTGITIKSTANPDGTRTVTKTDKDGKLLSRKRVR